MTIRISWIATTTAVQAAGYDAAFFTDTMAAMDALKATHLIEILITRVLQFRLGRLQGLRWRAFRGEAPLASKCSSSQLGSTTTSNIVVAAGRLAD